MSTTTILTDAPNQVGEPLEFWFEFASTYSYPAALRLRAAAAKARVPVVWKAFLLGPIFKDLGWADSPFNLQPAKGRYMWRDLERLCRQHGIPFRRPSEFPRNGLLAARVAASFHDQEWLPAFVERVYHTNFAEDHDIADRDTIADCLRAAGTDAERALAGALSDDGKARLRQNTSDAVSKGIFGAPSFVVGDELFWGNDRLEQALACARGWPASAQLGAPTRLPRATVGIEEESRSIGFDMASDRATGSLLRALAASKPDGHFLELGTGTGLATAWIADGMSATARLDTVDSDPELVAVARRHLAEDDRIHFRVGDASELIANLSETYDLIFADSWPGKFTLLDETLDHLSPGGLYVIDDLLPQANWPDGHGANVEALLERLKQRVDLQMTRLDWSTGIAIVTRRRAGDRML